MSDKSFIGLIAFFVSIHSLLLFICLMNISKEMDKTKILEKKITTLEYVIKSKDYNKK